MNREAPPQLEDPRQALDLAHRTRERVRRALLRDAFAPFAMVWGAVWAVGFATSALYPSLAGPLWWVLDLLALLACVALGRQHFRRVSHPDGLRLLGSWVVFAAYLALLFFLAHPASPVQGSMFLVVGLMGGYVVQGLWLWRGQVFLGLFLTALALLGGWLAPGYYDWLMAALGGGALFGTGLYLWIAFRP